MEAKQAALLEACRLLEEAVLLIAAGGRPGLAADVAELLTAVDAAYLTEACATA
jgi:hypothetical protein